MKNYLTSLLVIFSLSALASDFPDEPLLFEIDSDSQIRGPAYSEIVSGLTDLEAQYPGLAQVMTYGKSVKGVPLTLIKIARRDLEIPESGAIYIGGSIHGNEYLNIEDRLPRFFLEQQASIKKYLDAGGAIYIAPILNPDGYDRRERENINGVDLNRDYTVVAAGVVGFRQPETQSLSSFLAKEFARYKKNLLLSLDYHCCIGALLYPWSFKGPLLSERDRSQHIGIASIMQKHLGQEMKFGTTPTILGYSAKGTSKDYYFERFGALSFTFEGRRGKEDKRFDDHARMWVEILQKL